MHVVNVYILVQLFQHAASAFAKIVFWKVSINSMTSGTLFLNISAYLLPLGRFGYGQCAVFHQLVRLNQLAFFLNLNEYLHLQLETLMHLLLLVYL